MEQEEQLNKIDDMSGETNPHRELIMNNTEKIEPPMTQMEQWPIFSNVLNYIQHDRPSHNKPIFEDKSNK